MQSGMIGIGIDPGLSGAAAAIYGSKVYVFRFPKIKSGRRFELDYWTINEVLYEFSNLDITITTRKNRNDEGVIKLAAIESVHSRPGQGVVSMFNFGMSVGALRAILACLKVPFISVVPTKWKGAILGNSRASKEASVSYVRSRYPEIYEVTCYKDFPEGRLLNKLDHNVSDAVCLAEYAIKHLYGSSESINEEVLGADPNEPEVEVD